MNLSKKVSIILKTLRQLYPRKTALLWNNVWELLIATILSAQTSDKQVNRVLPAILKKWPSPKELKKADPEELEKTIKSIGLFRSKTRYLIKTAEMISERFDGKVPSSMKGLLRLYGVSRKTANIVLSLGFGINEGIAVDTHVKRIARRLGLTDHTDPAKIEKDLMKLFPKRSWGELNLLLVQFGRNVCRAKKPACEKCPLKEVCRAYYVSKHI